VRFALLYQHDDTSVPSSILRVLTTSRVAVVFLSLGALQPLLALQTDSSVNDLMLQLALVLELLAAQRLQHCIPIFLSQEESQAEYCRGKGNVTQLVQQLPPVVCSTVVEAAAQALLAVGLQPTERLQTRTVQGSVEEILMLQVEWATVLDDGAHVHAAEKRERELTLVWTRRVLGCVNDASTESQVENM
jgi:hypothetical protein